MDFPLFEAHSLDLGKLRIRRKDGRRLLLPVAPCLLRTPERVILVDAGFDPGLEHRVDGVEWLRPKKDLGTFLEEQGLWLDDVSDIVLTHLHDDHAGGVLDRERGAALFPNARVHLQELALWKGLERVAKGGERFVSSELLDWLGESDQVVLHHGDWELDSSFRAYHTGGHTPGHQILLAGNARFQRDGDECLTGLDGETGQDKLLLLPGDMLSLRACFHPEFRTSSDVEPERAWLRRQELRNVSDLLTVYLYHAPAGSRFFRQELQKGYQKETSQ